MSPVSNYSLDTLSNRSLTMKRLNAVATILFFVFIFQASALAQTDEIREATGMPIPIGSPVIYGQVYIKGMPKGERPPTIFVSLVSGGAQIDRREANDRGYYFFLERPRPGLTLIFEVDSNELGRANIMDVTSSQVRQDVTINWTSIHGGMPEQKTGVIVTKGYPRGEEADKQFDKGMAAIRDKKSAEAMAIFKEMVKKDQNDYLVWTMLGTISYGEKQYSDAVASLEKALTLKPDLTIALLALGKVELSQEQYDKAIETLKRAVDLEPNSADANQLLGEAYLRAKRGSLAVGFLYKAIELAPIEKAEIHLRLAALYNAAGLKDRAAAEYKAFLVKVPNYRDRKKMEQYIKDNSPKG